MIFMAIIKRINIINILINSFITIIVLLINCFLYFNKIGYSFAAFMLSIVGLINLVFLCIKEAKVLTYDTKRYTLILHVSHVILGLLMNNVVKHINDFYSLKIVYWSVLILSLIVPIVVTYFLNSKDDKKRKISTNQPKFMINK